MSTRLGRIEAIEDPKPAVSNLTSDEIALLERFAAGAAWWERLIHALLNGVVPGLLVCVVSFSLWLLLAPVDDPRQFLAYFVAFGLAVGLFVALSFLRSEVDDWRRERSGAVTLKQDIIGGIAHALELDINRVIEIEEFEDEGVGFFLELTDGRVVCLISQDLYDYASDIDLEDGEEDLRGQLPQTRISYRYAPHSGHCLDLTGVGEPLRPFGKVKTTARFFKKDKQTGQRSYNGPENGMVYEGPLEATLSVFKYELDPI